MIPPNVYALCRSGKSVSGELAKDPTLAPSKAAHSLFGGHTVEEIKREHLKDAHHGSNDIEQAFECGNWGESRPSDLFLQIYHDVLCTLEKNPLAGMTSPSLMGSSGVLPLSILAPLPEICKHMSNCIVRAEKEVFLATNFWIHSNASTFITNALRELSKRAGDRGDKVVVKILYDRGNVKQLIHHHQPVSVKEYTGEKINLPAPEEVPNLSLQVVNYHKPPLGTFHCKFMIVDRKVAILQSNNIQDNDNMEMMSHFEGPIVDSFYDMAQVSWNNTFDPPLPCVNSPAAALKSYSFHTDEHKNLFGEAGNFKGPRETNPMPEGADNLKDVAVQGTRTNWPEHTTKDPHYDAEISSEVLRVQATLRPRGNETWLQATTRYMNTTIQPDTTGNGPDLGPEEAMTPYMPHPPHPPFPIAMACREPWGAPNHGSVYTPQNESFIGALRYAKRDIFIQTPNLNGEPLLPEILAAARRGIEITYYVCLGYNDAGELLPFQNGTNEMVAHRLYTQLEKEYHKNLNIHNYIAKDQKYPIHNKFKKRSCHTKLLIADGHIGIQGNGNQDTQSWFHSQEINIMLDSPEVCKVWRDGIERNQNTKRFGAVTKEGPDAGCWINPDTGKQAEGAIGIDAGQFSWAKGIIGAVQRVRGAGGF